MVSLSSLKFLAKFHVIFVVVGVFDTFAKYLANLPVSFSRISVVCLTVEPGLITDLLEFVGSTMELPGFRKDVHNNEHPYLEISRMI